MLISSAVIRSSWW